MFHRLGEDVATPLALPRSLTPMFKSLCLRIVLLQLVNIQKTILIIRMYFTCEIITGVRHCSVVAVATQQTGWLLV